MHGGMCGMYLQLQLWEKTHHLIENITKAKSVEGMAQEVEHLISKCSALSRNTNATTINK
jgi:hypothetical protein